MARKKDQEPTVGSKKVDEVLIQQGFAPESATTDDENQNVSAPEVGQEVDTVALRREKQRKLGVILPKKQQPQPTHEHRENVSRVQTAGSLEQVAVDKAQVGLEVGQGEYYTNLARQRNPNFDTLTFEEQKKYTQALQDENLERRNKSELSETTTTALQSIQRINQSIQILESPNVFRRILMDPDIKAYALETARNDNLIGMATKLKAAGLTEEDFQPVEALAELLVRVETKKRGISNRVHDASEKDRIARIALQNDVDNTKKDADNARVIAFIENLGPAVGTFGEGIFGSAKNIGQDIVRFFFEENDGVIPQAGNLVSRGLREIVNPKAAIPVVVGGLAGGTAYVTLPPILAALPMVEAGSLLPLSVIAGVGFATLTASVGWGLNSLRENSGRRSHATPSNQGASEAE